MINEPKDNTQILLDDFSFIWANLHKTYNLSIEEMIYMKSMLDNNDVINHGVGSMFGAFIGDSLGSYCEFRKNPFQYSDPELLLTMQMPGKGTFNTKPGQFTDDSEMASHMLQALSTFNPSISLVQQQTQILFQIAQQYVDWYNTDPFDIGMTTSGALNILDRNLKIMKKQLSKGEKINQENLLNSIFQKISTLNNASCSNGSLMRITPMAFFISLLLNQQRKKNPKAQCKDFKNFIMSEISMTHGNPQIFESSYAWVELLVSLILRNKEENSLKTIYQNFIDKYKGNSNIGKWIEDSLTEKDMDATIHQGWAKIAFTYGIKALKVLTSINETELTQQHYTNIIKRVISKAGDSDTNAAIVGGLVGSVVGFKKLPKNYLFKQFQLSLDENNSQCSFRGKFYEPKKQFYISMKLVKKFIL